MKNTLIVVIAIAVLGVLGYFFYGALQEIENEETNYDFIPAEVVSDEFNDINDLLDSEFDAESDLDALAGLDFEEPITEENIEQVLEDTEVAENEIDASLDDLEALDF